MSDSKDVLPTCSLAQRNPFVLRRSFFNGRFHGRVDLQEPVSHVSSSNACASSLVVHTFQVSAEFAGPRAGVQPSIAQTALTTKMQLSLYSSKPLHEYSTFVAIRYMTLARYSSQRVMRVIAVHFHRHRLIFQAGEVRYGKKTD